MLNIIKNTTPVLFGYIPLGMAFGILFQSLGYPWYVAMLMAIFVYAGAAQFMAVGLLAAGTGLIEVAILTFFLNFRHIFYGLSMLNKYGKWSMQKLYLIFGLTDETYSLLTTINPPKGIKKEKYYFIITALNQSYWIFGCTLGALIGGTISINTEGMDFALTALFVVLVIEQYKKIKDPLPFIIAIISAFFAIYFFNQQMLIVSIVLSVILLIVIKKGRYE